MNIVLFESAGKQKYNAGSKARQDALQIAKDCGYRAFMLTETIGVLQNLMKVET